jgi:hypothetical protein
MDFLINLKLNSNLFIVMLYSNSFYIDYLLTIKDDEIDYFNKNEINSIFVKYMNKEITKDFLLDKHSKRNELFIDWFHVHNYQIYLKN